MRRLLINDAISQLGEVTLWSRLQEWFGMEFLGGPYEHLHALTPTSDEPVSVIIRNGSYFAPLVNYHAPTISLIQDIFTEGPQREMQEKVIKLSNVAVFNSEFTYSKYAGDPLTRAAIIPLPVDFSLFEPQNAMGCQQALGLPAGCVCWIGASQGAAAQVKGWDIVQSVARHNPDINFVCVFKDAIPETMPPNMRCYERLSHAELLTVIGACRVGLCTSRTESQHLAGIEMGACGLPMVAPRVGVYWKGRENVNSVEREATEAYTVAVRAALETPHDPAAIRESWRKEFDIPVIKEQWMKLVAEVECSGAS